MNLFLRLWKKRLKKYSAILCNLKHGDLSYWFHKCINNRIYRGIYQVYIGFKGGRIDHGHHEGKAQRALNEFVAFESAIGIGLRKVALDDSLVVVTADHSHVLDSFDGFIFVFLTICYKIFFNLI